MAEAAKDLTAGTVGGIAQLVVGHPFDTIKVKLQSQPSSSLSSSPSPLRYASAMDAVKKTIAQEGPRGLFKGMGAPLASVAALNAVLFTTRGQMENILRRFSGSGEDSKNHHLSISQQIICGVGAGAAVSVLACPTELVKCRLQAQGAMATTTEHDMRGPLDVGSPNGMSKHRGPLDAGSAHSISNGKGSAHSISNGKGALHVGSATNNSLKHKGPLDAGSTQKALKYNGPLHVVRHVIRAERGALGLFTGLVPTLLREVPGNAIMFGVYETIKRYLAGGEDTSSLGIASIVASGGLAGACYWVSVYPADVIKSLVQVDDSRNPKYRGTVDAFRKVYLYEGLKGLYKGFSPAMARSVPANAACFLAYEIVKSNLNKL